MNIRERQAEDLEVVRGLLETGGLPSNGLERTTGWIAEENGQIISHIALEEADGVVVLRSLATTPAAQGRGVARQLMDIAETHTGSRTILLRTKTVGPWVLRRGYALIASDQVPVSALSTSEFEGSMCSGYPIYMKG
jgi:N-acetylglutamate synthase-like GNAT family acetyltransferase